MKTTFRVAWHLLALVGLSSLVWLLIAPLLRGGHRPERLWTKESPDGRFEVSLVRSYWMDGDPEDRLVIGEVGSERERREIFRCWDFSKGEAHWRDDHSLEITYPNDTILLFVSFWTPDRALHDAPRVNIRLIVVEKKAQPDAQHNAGGRTPMNDSPASDTPSSPAPRG